MPFQGHEGVSTELELMINVRDTGGGCATSPPERGRRSSARQSALPTFRHAKPGGSSKPRYDPVVTSNLRLMKPRLIRLPRIASR